jgi:hypothetical protein
MNQFSFVNKIFLLRRQLASSNGMRKHHQRIWLQQRKQKVVPALPLSRSSDDPC